MDKTRSRGKGSDRRPVLDSYARLSWKPGTEELEKIDDQHADNARVIERSGGVLGMALDDGASAWKKNSKRPGWDTLIERVRSGESDGVVVWNTDRLLRLPPDLELLIDLGDQGYRILSATGEYSLADADHRFILRIKTAQAAKESDDKSRRIKRRLQGQRERGIPHKTSRRFGFPGKDRTWTPGPGETKADRPDVPASLVAREVAAIREATDLILSGVNDAEVARRWNKQGLPTVTGGEWQGYMVRDVLDQPLLAGLIEYDGVAVSRVDGDPILDEDTFGRLRAKFAARRRGRVAGQTYLASGLLTCVCGKPLSGQVRANGKDVEGGRRKAVYKCHKHRGGCGRNTIDVDHTDAELRVFVIERLSDPEYAAAIRTARDQVAARLAEVEAEITECEAIQEDLAERLGRREITRKAFAKANTPLSASLTELYAEQEKLSGGSPEGPTEALTADEIAARWDDAEIPQQRAMLKQAMGDTVITIARAAAGAPRRFDPNRFQPGDDK